MGLKKTSINRQFEMASDTRNMRSSQALFLKDRDGTDIMNEEKRLKQELIRNAYD